MEDRESLADKLKAIRDKEIVINDEIDQKEIDIRYTQFKERLTTEEMRIIEINYQRHKIEKKEQDHKSQELRTHLMIL